MAACAWGSHFEKGAPLFYKSPHSQFPSGQLSEDDLDSKKVRSEETNTYQVRWDKRDFFFETNEMVKDVHVSDLLTSNRSFSVPERKDPKSKEAFYVSKNDVVRLVNFQDDSLEIESLRTGKKGFAHSSDFSSFSEDVGLALTYMSTFLKESASDSSKIITTVPQGIRLKITEWSGEKILVHYNGKKGFIDSGHTIMKADFASWTLHSKQGWTQIKYREGRYVRTKQNDLLNISDLKSFVTEKMRAFSLISKDNGPKLKSKLEIVDLEPNRWIVSKLAEHGEVWWKKLRPAAPDQVPKTLAELASTGVFSSDIAAGSPTRGLISAKGIYRTDDGVSWSKLDFFKDENWPVCITKSVWYVGAFSSLDEGKTFEPFIRWDYLSYLVSSEYPTSPKYFKILKIENLNSKEIKIQMDVGFKKLSFSYNSYQTAWKLLPDGETKISKASKNSNKTNETVITTQL
jgi:hypothetical protein